MGAATKTVRALAAARPPARQAIISRGQVTRRVRPRALARPQTAKAATAASPSGQNGGSNRSVK